jgi:hypothetical protein
MEETGDKNRRRLSVTSRRELTGAVAPRYRASTGSDKREILDEFSKVTGFHRKYAIRVLNRQVSEVAASGNRRGRSRIYDQAVQEALVVVWEAADRICAKRLKQILPVMVSSMERHGHCTLDAEVRERLLTMSAATMDRLLKAIRQVSSGGRRRSGIRSMLRNSITVGTFSDWNDPAPGFFEMDFVAHCGKSVTGSHLHSLVLTDIASGWTEAAAMVVREQMLVAETVQGIGARLPFPMLGLDVDNDSAFINATLLNYCREHGLELTRSRAYRKNDQAWIEQKNGAVIRKMVGYGRLEGLGPATALARLHDVARLYVNYFQPSFKLKSKAREGAKVSKKYHVPATPADRLLASDKVSVQCKQQLREAFAALDPVELLRQIREAQARLSSLEVGGQAAPPPIAHSDASVFVASLSVAWQNGEVRPTHRKQARGSRTWRTRVDPFEEVWPTIEQWLVDAPDASAKELHLRLLVLAPERFHAGQLRTLQRRVKIWRNEMVRQLVFGASRQSSAEVVEPALVSL